MPTELVLLSNTAVTSELICTLGEVMHPGGVLMEYRGGEIRQFIDVHGDGILSLFTTRLIEVRREVQAVVKGEVGDFQLWTPLAIPFGDPTTGRVLADAIADAVGGQVKGYA